jgi:serine/threonine protein kinase
MNWLDKFKGKGGQPDGRDEDKPRQGRDREAGGTVVRSGAKMGPTIARPGIRFHPNHEITADLQIKSLLGSGGMGEVYLARQRLWDVDVALKIPNDEIVSDPENRHRIVREAEAWTDLGLHPNIAYCYYVQPLGELLLLVIEYVDGGNLRDWIANGRCADLKTGLDLAIQFCHGLEHAHNKGLVHRDIKPENVLLMQDGTLKITDFGIVSKKLASPEALESTGAVRRIVAGVTTAGIGTAEYMAPEQWADQGGIDSRADIFAFGVCLYEMLCGARPYCGDYATAGPSQEAPSPGLMRGKV